MRRTSEFLGLVAAAIFVATSVVTLLLFNLQRVVSDREAIKSAVRGEILLDEAIAAAIRHDLRDQPFIADLPFVIRNSDALEQALDDLVPETWANNQSDQVVDSFFSYLESGDEEALVVWVEIGPLFERLSGEPGRQIVLAALEGLPACGLDDLPNLDLASGAIDITVCMPPLVPVDLVAGPLHGLMATVINEQTATAIIGDRFEFNLLALDPATRSESLRNLERWRLLYLTGQVGVWLLWLVPLGFLVTYLLLGVRSWSALGLWLGIPVTLAMATAFISGLLVPAILPSIVLGGTPEPGTPEVIVEVVNRILRLILGALLDEWRGRVLLQSGAGFLFGTLAVVLGLVAHLVKTSSSLTSPAK